ncbi:MAG: hypothetical protein Q9192_001609 [Flavoplaca navasiana]
MSSTIGLGVPVPKMLPVTGVWTVPFTAYLLLLSNRVVYQRVKNKQWIGDKLNAEKNTTGDAENPDPLFLEGRCHMNFLESVPLAFVLAAIAELNGANRTVLNYAMAALFALRVGHVEVGLRGKGTMASGRPIGLFGTQGFMAGMAVQLNLLPNPLNPHQHPPFIPQRKPCAYSTAAQKAASATTSQSSITSTITDQPVAADTICLPPAAEAEPAPLPLEEAQNRECAVCHIFLGSAGAESERFNFPRTAPFALAAVDSVLRRSEFWRPCCSMWDRQFSSSNLEYLASPSPSPTIPPPDPLQQEPNSPTILQPNSSPQPRPLPKWMSALPSNRLKTTTSPSTPISSLTSTATLTPRPINSIPEPPSRPPSKTLPSPSSIQSTKTPTLRKTPSLLSSLTSRLRNRSSSTQLYTALSVSVVKGRNRSSGSGSGGFSQIRSEKKGRREMEMVGYGDDGEEEGSMEMVEM